MDLVPYKSKHGHVSWRIDVYGRDVGSLSVKLNVDPNTGSHVCISQLMVKSAEQGKHYGREAIKMISKMKRFSKLPMVAYVQKDNIAAKKVFLACGFRLDNSSTRSIKSYLKYIRS